MIYHYTDRDSAQGAIRDGALRLHPVRVFEDFLMTRPVVLASAVWFTRSDSIAPTIAVRLKLEEWSIERPGDVWRFGVLDETVPDDLIAWSEPHLYSPELFRWMVVTANMVGESWEDWRLSSVDVLCDQWQLVQSLHGNVWHNEPLN